VSLRVRRATPADDAAVRALLPQVVEGADAGARFDWLYVGNPAGRALTWLAVDVPAGQADGPIVGLTSFFPWRLMVDGHERRAALGGDGWVAPTHRRQGIGGMLHAASRAEMIAEDILCMYGAPGAMNVTPLLKGGSTRVGDVARYARPLGGPGRLARARLLVALSRRLLVPPTFGVELDPVHAGDERVDEVWLVAKGELDVACVRDASFYTWRYLQAPAGVQKAFVVQKGDRPLAVCALEETEGTVRIQDLLAPTSTWGPALRAILAWSSRRGARMVDIKLAAADAVRRRLWRWGFVPRDKKPFLVMARDAAGTAGGAVLDPQRWFYTGGSDSDVEFT